MKIFSYVLTSPNTEIRMESFMRSWRKARDHYLEARSQDGTLGQLDDDAIRAAFDLSVVHGMNSERFERSPWWRLGSEPTDLPDKQTGNRLDRRGHTACYWGHVQEWRQALGEHDANFDDGAALFMEDDCAMDVDFWTRLHEGVAELPDDWDVFYLGGELCVHGRPRPSVFSDKLYKVDNVNRTHCYMIRLASLPKVVLWFEEHHEWGHNFRDPKTGQSEAEVDYALGSLTETGFLSGYALRRWACGQAPGYSWTQGRNYPGGRWELD